MCDVFCSTISDFEKWKKCFTRFLSFFCLPLAYIRGVWCFALTVDGVWGDYVWTREKSFLHSHCGSRWGEGRVRLHYRQRENWSTFSITIDFPQKDFTSKKEFSVVICDVSFWNEGWPVKRVFRSISKDVFVDLISYIRQIAQNRAPH